MLSSVFHSFPVFDFTVLMCSLNEICLQSYMLQNIYWKFTFFHVPHWHLHVSLLYSVTFKTAAQIFPTWSDKTTYNSSKFYWFYSSRLFTVNHSEKGDEELLLYTIQIFSWSKEMTTADSGYIRFWMWILNAVMSLSAAFNPDWPFWTFFP